MTNFDSDKVIIIYYEAGAGGRFLANNLSLSPDCVMMNAKLAMMQLDGNLNQQQKLLVLLNKFIVLKDMPNVIGGWDDLGFYDTTWYGTNHENIREKYGIVNFFDRDPDEFKNIFYVDESFQYVTVNDTKYFFLTCHTPTELKMKLLIWKNAKVVSFKNQKLFTTIRNYKHKDRFHDYHKLKVIWGMIPEEERNGWQEPPSPYESTEIVLNFDDGNMIPKNMVSTLRHYLNDPEFMGKVDEHMRLKYSIPVPNLYREYKDISKEEKLILEKENAEEDYVHPNSTFVWDCNWYLSEEDTLRNIKKLYDVLGLCEYNKLYTKYYYKMWINKLDELIKIN